MQRILATDEMNVRELKSKGNCSHICTRGLGEKHPNT